MKNLAMTMAIMIVAAAGTTAVNAQNFVLEDQTSYSGSPSALAVGNDLVFFAMNDLGGATDYITPMNLRLTSGNNLPVGDDIRDLAVCGDHLYLVTASGLEIWTATTNATVVSDSYVDPDLTAIYVTGGNAYLAAGNTIDVVDVSTPTAPVLRGSVAAPGVRSLTVKGNVICAACSAAGLRVYEVTETDPVFVGNNVIGENAVDVAMLGDMALVISEASAYLILFDVSGPAPTVQSYLDGLAGTGMKVRVDGHFAYVGTSSRLYAVDFTDIDAPNQVGALEFEFAGPIDVAAGRLYVMDSDFLDGFSGPGLHASVSTSGLPTQTWSLVGIPVALTDPADGTAGTLFEDDLGPYGDPRWEMSRWNEATDSYDRFGSGTEPPLIEPGLGYWLRQDVVEQATIDVDPDQYDTSPVSEVVISGRFLGPTLMDISHVMLANPFNRTYNAADITFTDSRLDWTAAIASVGLNAWVYTWDGENYAQATFEAAALSPWRGFWLVRTGEGSTIDVNFPVVGPAKSERPAWPEHWRLDLAVATADGAHRDRDNGLGGTASSLAGYDPHDAFELAPMGDRFVSLYFTTDGQRLAVDNRELEVGAARRHEFTVWTHRLPGEELVLTWPNLAQQDPALSFTLVDAAGHALADLRTTDRYDFTSADAVDDRTQLAIIVARDAVVTPPPAVGAVQITSVHPNPFNPVTTVAIALAQDGEIELAVHDVRGRLVATLAEGTYTAGDHHLRWDAAGVAAGSYVLRLSAGGQTTSCKVTIVK